MELKDWVADLERRQTRTEQIMAFRTNERSDKPEEMVALEKDLLDELDNRKNENGHSPKMLRDWQKMMDDGIAHGKTPEQAEKDLVRLFKMIEDGELNADGSPKES